MFYIVILLFIISLILSIIIFKVKGLLILIITIPLSIMYYYIDKIKKKNTDKNNLSEREEVLVVSSRSRKKRININFSEIKEKLKEKINFAKLKEKLKFKKKKEKLEETKEFEETKEVEMKKTEKKKRVNNTRKKRNKDTRGKTKNKGKGRKILTIILGLTIFGVFSICVFFIYIVISCGDFDPEALKNQEQTVIYDKDNNIITTLGDEKREEVDFDELPQVLIDAIVATEDSRFYQHNGVDTARFLKATLLQLIGQDDAGGASTLTMQTVKNNLTKKNNSENRIEKLVRKFKDVYLSVFFMEKRYSKEEILEMYVNDSGLGGMIYGVGEASKYYFGKTVSELSLPEASLLAGMYQAPTKYNPFTNPEAAAKRRSTVLKLMKHHGYITEEERKMAESVSIESMLANNTTEANYGGYIDTVIEEVERKTGNNPTTVSMKIYTAMDRSVQDGINKVLSGEAYTGWVDDKIQAGIAVTNVNDGTIIAIGAGRNRKAGDWNYATQSHRQPGSTAKPIFDYGPGFEFNNFSTYTLFNDEPWGYTNGPAIGNWDSQYQGLITLRQALSVSRNIPALKAFQQIDKKNIAKFVNDLGLDIAYSTSSANYKKYDDGGDNVLNEAYAIGGLSHGVTPLEMAEAYACFANGGYHIETHAVTKIEYRSTGEVVEFDEDKEKVMSDSTAYLMNNVLKYAVDYAFSGGAKVYGMSVAAKTGTSNLDSATAKAKGLPEGLANDLWTVAYTPEHAVALWYGYETTDKDHFMYSASAPKDAVMRAIMPYIPRTNKTWEVPSSVVAVTVEKESWPARLPSAYTPDNMKITEYFKKGTQPTEISDRYEKLDAVTNLKASTSGSNYQLTWDWKVPNILDNAYLTKYFSNSVYGNQSSTYLGRRLEYNNSVLGENGFGIYKKTSAGLERIGFTTDTKYTYKPAETGSITLVVKAEYKNFKDNASDSAEVKLTVNNLEEKPADNTKLKLSLTGDKKITITSSDTYSDRGISATFEGKDVTKEIKITYKISNKTYTSKDTLEEAVNSLESGTYTLSYYVTYKDYTTFTSRTIIIEDSNENEEN